MTDRPRVGIVGVYPPPIGGVSIHIQRLMAGCRDNGIRCIVFDVSRRLKKVPGVYNIVRVSDWPRILFSPQDIVHIHTTNMNWKIPSIFCYLAIIKGARLVFSCHSLIYRPQDFSPLGRRMMKMMLKTASHCIAVNAEMKEKLVSMGARPDKVIVLTPYLPPLIKEEEIAEIPPEVWSFMKGHKPLLSANGSAIYKFNGEDLYGMDMCIDLCAALKSIYPGVGLVFCLQNISDYDYFHELKRKIAEKGIEDNFLFQTKPCQFYPVLMKSDIFVRPTNTDGDAISLREALYLKVPSVASDAVPRPEGTAIFKSRDTAGFIDCVKEVWENYTDHKKRVEHLSMPDVLGEILAIYRRVAGESSES